MDLLIISRGLTSTLQVLAQAPSVHSSAAAAGKTAPAAGWPAPGLDKISRAPPRAEPAKCCQNCPRDRALCSAWVLACLYQPPLKVLTRLVR